MCSLYSEVGSRDTFSVAVGLRQEVVKLGMNMDSMRVSFGEPQLYNVFKFLFVCLFFVCFCLYLSIAFFLLTRVARPGWRRFGSYILLNDLFLVWGNKLICFLFS